MDFDIVNKNLSKLYETGKNRKYPLQRHVFKKFVMRVQEVEAAQTVHDFWAKRSLNFEKMEGYENRFSMRVDGKWRLELEVVWKDEEHTRGFVHIAELSKHYGG